MNIRNSVTADIANLLAKSEITKKESAILGILMLNWGIKKIKQKEIAENGFWKKLSTGNSTVDSETREIRKIIRKLRVNCNIPIIHDIDGHYLPETEEEVNVFLERLESEAKKRAAASLETYKAMKESLGVTSNLLDKLDMSGTQLVIYEKG